MAAQCPQSKAIEWRQSVAASQKDPLDVICGLEGWTFDGACGPQPVVSQVTWLWSACVPDAHCGLCFGAWKLLVAKRHQHLGVLNPELDVVAGEALTLRHGATVRHGVDVLVHLAQCWGRQD